MAVPSEVYRPRTAIEAWKRRGEPDIFTGSPHIKKLPKDNESFIVRERYQRLTPRNLKLGSKHMELGVYGLSFVVGSDPQPTDLLEPAPNPDQVRKRI